MTFLLALILAARLAAVGWGAWLLLRHARGQWTILLLVGLLLVAATEPIAVFFYFRTPTVSWGWLAHIGELAISGLLLAAVMIAGRLLRDRTRTIERLREESARLEEARRHAADERALLEKAQAIAHVGSWVWEPEVERGLSWSRETFRIFGVSPAWFDGRVERFRERVHPEDLPAVRQASDHARATGTPYSIVHRIIRPDGQVRWVHEHADVLTDPHTGRQRFIGVVQDITERLATEQTLRNSEQRYRQTFDLNPNPMWMYDTVSLRFLDVNRAAERVYGYTRDEFLAMTIEAIRPPEDVPALHRHLEQIRTRRGRYQSVWRHRRKDGTVFEAEITAVDAPGVSPTARFVQSRDVTEERRIQRLREGHGRVLEWLARGAPLPDIFHELVRVTEAQVPGSACAVHVLDESRTRLLVLAAPSLPEAFSRAIHGCDAAHAGSCGEAIRTRQRVVVADLATDPRAKDARDLMLAHGLRACWSQPILGPGGVVHGTLAMYCLTAARAPQTHEAEVLEWAASLAGIAVERRLAEESLRQANERLSALIESSPQPIVALDRHGHVCLWNPAAERTFGWSRAEALGRPPPIVPPERLEEFSGLLERVLRGESLRGVELQRRRRDGEPITVSLSAAPLHGPDGQVTGVMALLVDITQLKRLETELRQKQKLEAVGRLASGIAHDFNNLLIAISGHIALARRTLSPNHPATRSLDRVDDAARQASGVIRSLLTFTREGSTPKHPTDLTETIEHAVRFLRRTLPPHVRLRVDLPREPVLILGDPAQLQQMVINLALNARDAMPQGGTLHVALHPPEGHDASDSQARLVVSDTGAGIAPDVLPRIFEPFFTTKPPGQGTGLGLAIVHSTVKDHGGQIEVCSTPGQGTTFVIRLPAAQPSTAEPVPAPSPGRNPPVAILATDHAYTRELIASMLQRMGYQVQQVSNGPGLLDACQHRGPQVSLLVIDDEMPDLSGSAGVRAARAQGCAASALLLTGPRGAREPPPDDVCILRKPFQLRELSAAVRAALATAQGSKS